MTRKSTPFGYDPMGGYRFSRTNDFICPEIMLQAKDLASDAGTAPRQTDHGGDQEQHYRDEEDDLGDFDGGSGDAAEAQNACDQGDDQDVTTQLSMIRTSVSTFCSMSARPKMPRVGCRTNPASERMFRAVPGA